MSLFDQNIEKHEMDEVATRAWMRDTSNIELSYRQDWYIYENGNIKITTSSATIFKDSPDFINISYAASLALDGLSSSRGLPKRVTSLSVSNSTIPLDELPCTERLYISNYFSDIIDFKDVPYDTVIIEDPNVVEIRGVHGIFNIILKNCTNLERIDDIEHVSHNLISIYNCNKLHVDF